MPEPVRAERNNGLEMKKILFILFFILGCTHHGNRTWKVAILAVPTEIKPAAAEYTVANYILIQTHEPLFRYDENNQIVSRVLNKWSRTNDFKTFLLCPKQDVAFDEGQKFEAKDIEKVIYNTWNDSTPFTTKTENNCVTIKFESPRLNFYEVLADIGKAPSRPTSNPQVDIGLGPFKVDKFSKKEVLLSRKKSDRTKQFDKIILENVEIDDKTYLNDRTIQDFNLLPISKRPTWIEKEFASYPVADLEIYVLAQNNPNLKIRRAVANCLNVVDLRNAFFQQNDIREIGSLFPIGIKGAVSKRIQQNCTIEHPIKTKPLIFLNWRQERHQNLVNLFDAFRKKTGIEVRVKDVNSDEFIQTLFMRRSGYDLAILSLSDGRGQPSAYLEIFADAKKVIHSLHMQKLEKKYAIAINLDDKSLRDKHFMEINDEILSSALALPLFQMAGQVQYPKSLKSPQFGSTFNEYPEVDGIQ